MPPLGNKSVLFDEVMQIHTVRAESPLSTPMSPHGTTFTLLLVFPIPTVWAAKGLESSSLFPFGHGLSVLFSMCMVVLSK